MEEVYRIVPDTELVHKKIFSKARKEGRASDMVLTQLKFAASAPLLQELVGIRKDLEVRACSQYKYSSNVKKSLQSSLRIQLGLRLHLSIDKT
jgi:hypothetical protein